jgi:hypothetical protein
MRINEPFAAKSPGSAAATDPGAEAAGTVDATVAPLVAGREMMIV